MGMLFEDQAREVVANDSSLNIHKGRIAAYKAIMEYLASDTSLSEGMYVPDIPPDDQRLDDVSMTSYNSVRNSWIAMYEYWKYPDLFVVVQYTDGSVYTQVNKHLWRASDHSQATLF